MNPTDEKRLRENWDFIKHEIDVECLVRRMVTLGVFTAEQKDCICGTNTLDTKAEMFLEAVLEAGNKAYQTMCNILLENRNLPRNQSIIRVLEIQTASDTNSSADSRQTTDMSLTSSTSSLNVSIGDGAEGCNDRLVSARAPWRATITRSEDLTEDDMKSDMQTDEVRPTTPADAVHMAVQKASDSKSGVLDMEALEQELVNIAPTIADLFSKIQQQTTVVVGKSEFELQKIKEDNDRLRKTNRSLVEKLNSFQQKIIQLQLENKKLREVSENEKVKANHLDERSTELALLKEKLLEQKKALENKELELDLQLEKIANVINDNEEQKLKLANLEQLHEEGLRDYEDQQMQIQELQADKEEQKKQIEFLEEKQKMSEHLLYRLEERLLQLERGGPRKTRPRFGLAKPWMNGAVDRSHHVHVKLQPHFPNDLTPSTKGGKGWSF